MHKGIDVDFGGKLYYIFFISVELAYIFYIFVLLASCIFFTFPAVAELQGASVCTSALPLYLFLTLFHVYINEKGSAEW